ncbi:MAG: eL32 family ribosomal protein [Candidatus Marsarchaeota archaeon]|nr:eL32 family ribosomal protein [Candidatus Marsarchaeota archaeon]MCL5106043.1 eL32 family ribosomal protein [Candidatus Marsarchaeota archaeon]
MAEIKKRDHPTFNVPNYGTKKRKRVKPRWRKQRGIDNKKRVKKNFMGAEPVIGYGNRKEVKGLRANGRKPVLVSSMPELRQRIGEMKTDADRKKFLLIINHSIGTKKRQEMLELANKSDVKIANKGLNQDLIGKFAGRKAVAGGADASANRSQPGAKKQK